MEYVEQRNGGYYVAGTRVSLDSQGNLYIVDYLNYVIREVSGGNINTIRPSVDLKYFRPSPLNRTHILAFHFLGSLITGYGDSENDWFPLMNSYGHRYNANQYNNMSFHAAVPPRKPYLRQKKHLKYGIVTYGSCFY